MALSLSSLSRQALLFNIPIKSLSSSCFSPKFCAISPPSFVAGGINDYFNRSNNGPRKAARFSAVATESPPAPAVSDEVKIVLPTNQSSERLLKIRHTVNNKKTKIEDFAFLLFNFYFQDWIFLTSLKTLLRILLLDGIIKL